MSRHKFPSSPKTQTAREKLAKSVSLHFLEAMDLVMVQCEELYRQINRRHDPQEAAEQLAELRRTKHAASIAKLAWLEGVKSLEAGLAVQWVRSPDQQLAAIGICLQTGNYERLAR